MHSLCPLRAEGNWCNKRSRLVCVIGLFSPPPPPLPAILHIGLWIFVYDVVNRDFTLKVLWTTTKIDFHYFVKCFFFIRFRHKLQRKSSRIKFTTFSKKKKKEPCSALFAPPTKKILNNLGLSRDCLTSQQERSDHRRKNENHKFGQYEGEIRAKLRSKIGGKF